MPANPPPRLVAAALCLGLLSVQVACDRRAPIPPPAAPWVIVVTMDTTRRDHIGAYGGAAQTPALDGLAADGVRFEDALSVINITIPSHASLFTGLYPYHHGVHDNSAGLSAEAHTLAERLKAEGYRTGAVVSSEHLSAGWSGLGQGFDHYEDTKAEARADQSVAKAVAWLSAQDPQAPLFLWLHLFDPHARYDPPEPWNTMYYKGDWRDPSRPEVLGQHPFLRAPPHTREFQEWLGGVTDIEWPRALYRGEISYMDSQLAVLFGALKARDRYDSSVIVATADHGESLGEGGIFFDHQGLGAANFEVPLIMKLSENQSAGQVVAGPALGVDLLPTLLSVLGLSVGEGLDGSDLSGRLGGAVADQAPTLLESRFPPGLLVRDGPWALEVPLRAGGPTLTGPDATAEQRAEVGARLAAVSRRWFEGAAKAYPVAERAPAEMQRDMEERLRALGYVDP